jgi:spore maturation protein CgeB
LAQQGHRLRFYERNTEWYASNRDLPSADFVTIEPYDDWSRGEALARRAAHEADVVVAGSYAPDAIAVLDTVLSHGRARVCFYDIDTPITLTQLRAGSCSYLRADQVPALDVYFSFTGGPILEEIQQDWGARLARPLYCCCDPALYYPARGGLLAAPPLDDLGYMGTFAPDRQAKLHRLLIEPARRLPDQRFVVAGPLFPDVAQWPANVRNIYHLSPREHRGFYLSSRMTLNLTRQAMVEYGYSPSVRLFEAAACGVPVLTDAWPGIEEFFEPGREILVVRDAGGVVACLRQLSPRDLRAIGEAARARVLSYHSGEQRAKEFEDAVAAPATRSKSAESTDAA